MTANNVEEEFTEDDVVETNEVNSQCLTMRGGGCNTLLQYIREQGKVTSFASESGGTWQLRRERNKHSWTISFKLMIVSKTNTNIIFK